MERFQIKQYFFVGKVYEQKHFAKVHVEKYSMGKFVSGERSEKYSCERKVPRESLRRELFLCEGKFEWKESLEIFILGAILREEVCRAKSLRREIFCG